MTNLNRAIELAKTGNRDEAQKLLSKITKYDPDNSIAWLWLAAVTDEPTQKIKYLQNTIRLDPQNKTAQDALRRLVRSATPQPKVDEIVSPPPVLFNRPATDTPKNYSRRVRGIGVLIYIFFPFIFFLPAFAVINNKFEFFGRMILPCAVRHLPADQCSQPAGWLMLGLIIMLLFIAVFLTLSVEFSLPPEEIKIRHLAFALIILFLGLPIIIILFFGPIILLFMEGPPQLLGR